MANAFETERETPRYATIVELADNLVYRLPGCDSEMIRRALREAYVNFCRLSNALVTKREILLVADERTYPVVPLAPDSNIESIRSVFLAGRKLVPQRDYMVITGSPPCIRIRDAFLPEGGECECSRRHLVVECMEVPQTGCERAPDWFIDKYGDAVCAGALVTLFGMTGRAWSDPAQMRMELVKWENAVNGARIADAGGSQYGNGTFDAVDMSEVL